MSNMSEYTLSLEYAVAQDELDTLRRFRDEFTIPSKSGLQATTIDRQSPEQGEPCIYLCGNSLGLQPRRTPDYVSKFLHTWAQLGVYGHFKRPGDAVTNAWVDIEEQAAAAIAPLVGATAGEVAVMQTLTANLHLLLASFYRPTKQRYKIIIEGKAFPSDHYAVYSQAEFHGLDAQDAVVLIEPSDVETHYLSTSHILSVIEEHAESTAVLLLPGVHYYSGQYFDIPTITAYAQERGIVVGWDLAHAVGNVPLQLHEWNVDFAAWCSYKYLNAGAGSIAGLFVHEKHGKIASEGDVGAAKASTSMDEKLGYRHRLAGWWGSSKSSRFQMNNRFIPIPGAAGWQLSNPSTFDTTAVLASLSVFNETSMADLRTKSLKLTAYLVHLLDSWPTPAFQDRRPYVMLTPRNPDERGAQISVRLNPGMLEGVMEVFEREGVVVDERHPDVVRVAPAPLYNTFSDVWRFVEIFSRALEEVKTKHADKSTGGTMVDVPRHGSGWADIT